MKYGFLVLDGKVGESNINGFTWLSIIHHFIWVICMQKTYQPNECCMHLKTFFLWRLQFGIPPDDIYTTCWLITAVILAASLLWSDFNSNIDALHAHTQKVGTKLGSHADFLPIHTRQTKQTNIFYKLFKKI